MGAQPSPEALLKEQLLFQRSPGRLMKQAEPLAELRLQGEERTQAVERPGTQERQEQMVPEEVEQDLRLLILREKAPMLRLSLSLLLDLSGLL